MLLGRPAGSPRRFRARQLFAPVQRTTAERSIHPVRPLVDPAVLESGNSRQHITAAISCGARRSDPPRSARPASPFFPSNATGKRRRPASCRPETAAASAPGANTAGPGWALKADPRRWDSGSSGSTPRSGCTSSAIRQHLWQPSPGQPFSVSSPAAGPLPCR